MNLPASICGFFAEASSGESDDGFLKTTGPLLIEPGVDALFGSRRFAYRDRPPLRTGGLGVELFDIVISTLETWYQSF